MTTEDNPCEEPEAPVVHLRPAGPVSAGAPTVSVATLVVIQADNIEVEDSPTPKYLYMKNGTLTCSSAVYIWVNGERYEITMDHPPA